MWSNESLGFGGNDTADFTTANITVPATPGLGARAIVVPLVYSIICLVGIAGNGLVIYLVWRHREMRTVTNYYIVNLAVTDLAFLICCVPFSAAKIVSHSWEFGEFLCKFVFYFMQVTAQATCMTLAVLSLDRFWAIVKPFQTPWFRTPVGVGITTAIIWIGSFLLSLPIAFFMEVSERDWYGRKFFCIEAELRLPTVLQQNFNVFPNYQKCVPQDSFLLSLPIAFFVEVSERDWYGRKFFCIEAELRLPTFLLSLPIAFFMEVSERDWYGRKFFCMEAELRLPTVLLQNLQFVFLNSHECVPQGSFLLSLLIAFFMEVSERDWYGRKFFCMEAELRLPTVLQQKFIYFSNCHECVPQGSFLLSLPIAFFMEVSEQDWYGRKFFCMEEFPSEDEYRVYIIYTVLISYVIPLTTSVVSHCLILRYLATMAGNTSVAQQHVLARKKRVTRMVATVVILFALCWAPNHAANLWWSFKRADLSGGFGPVVMWLKIAALCLSYANSCVNPFVYGIMGDSFRKAFNKSFREGNSYTAGSAVGPRMAKNTKEEIGMMKLGLGAGETGVDKLTPVSSGPNGEINIEDNQV
ncbi:somatostatin receptor type 5-like [Branchiostoma floridae]|uniref:Somatostatin receptor type 5-like n=1 Tax=Branchiostoma floridae TaxID=7739 RepID=A0A9J7LW78_BRAFL|nr:somatostatin receptor type 5-like [Branchiostoma floridae]